MTDYYTRVLIPPICSWEQCQLPPTMMIIPIVQDSDGFAVGCGDHAPEIELQFQKIAMEVRQGNLENSIKRLETVKKALDPVPEELEEISETVAEATEQASQEA